MKWREKSKRSEATLTTCMDDYGMNGDSNLSQTVCVHLNKEDSQGKTTLTDNKKRDYENEGSSMHEDSCIGINNAHMFPKCFRPLHTLLGFSLCTSCQQFNCCSCTNVFSFWPVRDFLVEIHTAKMVLWGVVFTENGEVEENQTRNVSAWRWHMECDVHTPNLRLEPRMCVSLYEKVWRVWCAVHTHRWLQQTAVSCKRSDYNKKNLAKCHFWAALWRNCATGRPVPWCRSFTSSEVLDFLLIFHELHQESFHCHQDVLDEEDDGRHFWYCQERIGASRSSPDSQWRRCNFVKASLKSERSFIGLFLPDVLREIRQFFLYLKYSSCGIR